AVDGAVAKARTGAFFANDALPITSRTVQFISQSTIVQRLVDSDPNVPDPNSPQKGPGFVAPVGLKGHFPPGVLNTPQVDLFLIEYTTRDTQGALPSGRRFNIPASNFGKDEQLFAPESYGVASGIMKGAQARGIATLPGGLPIFKKGK